MLQSYNPIQAYNLNIYNNKSLALFKEQIIGIPDCISGRKLSIWLSNSGELLQTPILTILDTTTVNVKFDNVQLKLCLGPFNY